MTTPADLLAVQRIFATEGRDAAVAEVRRRWPDISDTVLERTLEQILAAEVKPPAQFDTPGDKAMGTRRGRRS